ncbi:MAG: hypothetical protein ACFCBW_10900 [Candidatus Competibacterales bacterium]
MAMLHSIWQVTTNGKLSQTGGIKVSVGTTPFFALLILTLPFTVWANPPKLSGDPNPMVTLTEAMSERIQGNYQSALENHLWLFDNILIHGTNFTKNNLDFALSEWYKLALIYPLAMEELLKKNNLTKKKLLSGKGILGDFRFVVTVNQLLEKNADSVELYTQLRETNKAMAQSFFTTIESVLIEEQEYALLDDGFDHRAKYDKALRLYKSTLGISSTDQNAARRDQVATTLGMVFTTQVMEIVDVLLEQGREGEAREVVQKASGELNDQAQIDRLEQRLSP